MKAMSNRSWQGDNPLNFALPLAILQICIVVGLTRFSALSGSLASSPRSLYSSRYWDEYRRIKLKKGDFANEIPATTESDIEETLKRLVKDIGKSPEEVFDTLKNQTVDLVLTTHPTQLVRRSLL